MIIFSMKLVQKNFMASEKKYFLYKNVKYLNEYISLCVIDI